MIFYFIFICLCDSFLLLHILSHLPSLKKLCSTSKDIKKKVTLISPKMTQKFSNFKLWRWKLNEKEWDSFYTFWTVSQEVNFVEQPKGS